MLNEIRSQERMLVAPIRHDFWQPDEHGVRKLRTVHTPSLLRRLRESLGSTAGGGRGGAEKRTRTIIDAAGVELWESITETTVYMYHKETGDWMRDGSRSPLDLLPAWLPFFLTRMQLGLAPAEDEDEQKRVLATLRGWVITIEDKFDPPRKIELLVPCPACKEEWFIDGIGDRSHCLVAVMPTQGETFVWCKACGKRWTGEAEISRMDKSRYIPNG